MTLKEIILVITWQSLLCFKFRNLQIRGNRCHFGNIVIDDLKNDILNSNALQNPKGSIDELVETYNTQLSAIIDKHAPVQSKTIIMRPNTKWYTEELRTAEQDRRKAERKMRKSKLTVDIQIYREKCNSVSNLLLKTKKQYLSDKIEEIGNDSKHLFKLTNNIMGKTKETILPSIDDQHQLANRFGRFFLGKIDNIRNDLSSTRGSSPNDFDIDHA